MDAPVIASIVAALSAVVCGYFARSAAIRATSVEERKVDQAAYDRAIVFYQRQLDDALKQLDRVTGQVDRLNVQIEKMTTQLASEQDVSNTLRNQVRTLQTQVDILNATISDLRERMKKRDTPLIKEEIH